jgi:diaminopimelate epimerase
MRFTKMQGAGNDYIYVNCCRPDESGDVEPTPEDPAALSRAMSDRHFGVGADGLILLCPSDRADVRMRMFNADGSEAEMCGNGIRCVAKYAYDYGLARKPTITVDTGRGVLSLDVKTENGTVDRVRVDMGEPIFEPAQIPTTLAGNPPADVKVTVSQRSDVANRDFVVTSLSMGNPHAVTFVDEPSDDLVLHWGPAIEVAPEFPRRVNVEFVQVISRSEIRMRVWERGSGETMACGTGACAAAVAAAVTGRTARQVRAHLPGGTLEIDWAENDHVYLNGPAVEVFTGNWPRERSQ